MANSSYYYNLMCSYARSKRDFQEKKESYNNFLIKLNGIKNIINSPKDLLDASYDNFNNGGYNDDGTPSRGKLTEASKKITNASDTLSTIITNTKTKLDEFQLKIDDYTKKYNEAKANYDSAKRQENG